MPSRDAAPTTPPECPPAAAWRGPAFAAALALAAAVGVMLALPAYWETNDDVSMSMIVHGYGLASAGSPSLIYSNVLWGRLLGALPDIAGVMPYSWLAMGLLAAIGAAFAWRLKRAGLGALVIAAAWVLVLSRPLVAPQFTMLAGLAAVAGLLPMLADAPAQARSAWRWPLAFAALLLAFLVRLDITLLLALLALPLLAWRELLRDRGFLAGAVATVALAALAFWLDRRHYDGAEWAVFNAMETVRVPFTDYHVAQSLFAQLGPGEWQGLSRNDVQLVSAWFFVDPAIADPPRLGLLLGALDTAEVAQANVPDALQSVRGLLAPPLLPLLGAALAAAATSTRPLRLALAWGALLVILFVLGLAGRPAPVRVCLPTLALLLLAALQSARPGVLAGRVRMAVLALAAALALATTWQAGRATQGRAQAVAAQVARLPADRLHVVWGATFPYELAYPVWLRRDEANRLALSEIGGWVLAPFTRAQWRRWHPGDFRTQLAAGDVSLVASPAHIHLLGQYCREHVGRPLRELARQELADFTRYQVTCAAPAAAR